MIRLVNVNKYFNRKKNNEIHVINNTSIELGDKGLVCFLGNSGCGKTTLLNAIGGLDKVNSGDIFIDDDRMTRRSDGKRDEIRNIHVGYIFQNYNLMEDESVFNNVAIVLKMMGVKDKDEIEKRVMYILERVGIARYKNRPAKMLSGGERQRVGIARAIVKNPKIIIADEPTGNLDSRNTIEIMNIIKAISREKLVILVTHEREIAQFYASRILEIVDGKIVSDKENQHDDALDLRMDNKIYLKDMPVQKEMAADGVTIKYYADSDSAQEIKVVVKNNNIYIQMPSGLSEGSDAVELVDDHYKKLSKDIYEDYEFGYEQLLDKNFRPRYTSIYNPWTLLAGGYKKIFNYSLIKKILLLGFIFASMFSIYAVSNISGITNITDDKFVTINQNYLTVQPGKITPSMYERYEKMEGMDYVLPGNSVINMSMPADDYYQSAGESQALSGSLSSTEMIDENSLIAGIMPEKKRDIVIDKMTADRLFQDYPLKMIGVREYQDLIGRKAEVPRAGKFTIVGITEQGSPSIYVDRSKFMDILTNFGSLDGEDGGGQDGAVLNYKYAKNSSDIKIVSGSAPTGDYEVLVSDSMRYEKHIGSTIDTKVNGRKLTISGFYSDKRQGNALYVNAKTAKYSFIETQSSLVLSPVDKAASLSELNMQNVKVTDNYEVDRQNYIDSMKTQIIATILVSVIILIISLIEMYLMLRSSFLSRIKEVGVLRAIGLKKRDIYKMFMGEIVAMTTLTTLPGMAVMAYILNGVSKVPMIGDQYLMNPLVFLASFALVFGFNLLAGLLPVFSTMRKTPAAILARNDVN